MINVSTVHIENFWPQRKRNYPRNQGPDVNSYVFLEFDHGLENGFCLVCDGGVSEVLRKHRKNSFIKSNIVLFRGLVL